MDNVHIFQLIYNPKLCEELVWDIFSDTQYENFKRKILEKTSSGNHIYFNVTNNRTNTDYQHMREKYFFYKIVVDDTELRLAGKPNCAKLKTALKILKAQKAEPVLFIGLDD